MWWALSPFLALPAFSSCKNLRLFRRGNQTAPARVGWQDISKRSKIMAQQDNSGMGVVLGVLVAIVVVVGAYFFLNNRTDIGAGDRTDINVTSPSTPGGTGGTNTTPA